PPVRSPTGGGTPTKGGPRDPDSGAFSLSLDPGLMNELGTVDPGDRGTRAAATTHSLGEDEAAASPLSVRLDSSGMVDEPDDSHGAKTTFAVDEEPQAKAGSANPFAMEVPDELEKVDL